MHFGEFTHQDDLNRDLELCDERELRELDHAVRVHLADPRTLMMPHLLIAAWGRKPS